MTCSARVVRLRVLGTWSRQRGAEAFEAVLQVEPHRESALEAAALLAGALGNHKSAISYWKRAIVVDPWRSSFHAELAGRLGLLNTGPRPSRRPSAALEINPANLQARRVLVASSFAPRQQGRSPRLL